MTGTVSDHHHLAALRRICEQYGLTPEDCKMRVYEGRKSIYLLAIGEIHSANSFYWEKIDMSEPGKGTLICVPDGWTVAVRAEGQLYMATTKYERNTVYYRFDRLNDAGQVALRSEWQLTPNKAFLSVRLDNRERKRHTGKLLLGLHYEAPQRLLREHFAARMRNPALADKYSADARAAVDEWLATAPKMDVNYRSKPYRSEEDVFVESSGSEQQSTAPAPPPPPSTYVMPEPKRNKPLVVAPRATANKPDIAAALYYPYNALHNILGVMQGQYVCKFTLHEIFALVPNVQHSALARVFVNCKLESDNRVQEDNFFAFLGEVEKMSAQVFDKIAVDASVASTAMMPLLDPRQPSTPLSRVTLFVHSKRPPAGTTGLDKDKFIFFITKLPPSQVLRAALRAAFSAAVEQQQQQVQPV